MSAMSLVERSEDKLKIISYRLTAVEPRLVQAEEGRVEQGSEVDRLLSIHPSFSPSLSSPQLSILLQMLEKKTRP